MEDLHRMICLFYQLINRHLGRTAWIGHGTLANNKLTIPLPECVDPDLVHLADVPEVGERTTSSVRLNEAPSWKDSKDGTETDGLGRVSMLDRKETRSERRQAHRPLQVSCQRTLIPRNLSMAWTRCKSTLTFLRRYSLYRVQIL